VPLELSIVLEEPSLSVQLPVSVPRERKRESRELLPSSQLTFRNSRVLVSDAGAPHEHGRRIVKHNQRRVHPMNAAASRGSSRSARAIVA